MKNKFWFLIIILAIASFLGYQFFSKSNPKLTERENKSGILDVLPKSLEVGDLAPDFVSEDVSDNKVSLSDFRDKKPVLLIFWATWCGYCAKELPDLKDFTQEHQDEIQVIAVDSGEPRETIRDYIEEKEINFLMLLDEDRTIWNQYFVRGTPSHFLIDKQGKITALRPGLASRENLENLLTMLR